MIINLETRINLETSLLTRKSRYEFGNLMFILET